MSANVYTVVFIREVSGDDYEQGEAMECVNQLARELQACYDDISLSPAGSFQIIKAETVSWSEVDEKYLAGKVDTSDFIEHLPA